MLRFAGVLLTVVLRGMYSLNLLADAANIWHHNAAVTFFSSSIQIVNFSLGCSFKRAKKDET
jgi:hypothetical protein